MQKNSALRLRSSVTNWIIIHLWPINSRPRYWKTAADIWQPIYFESLFPNIIAKNNIRIPMCNITDQCRHLLRKCALLTAEKQKYYHKFQLGSWGLNKCTAFLWLVLMWNCFGHTYCKIYPKPSQTLPLMHVMAPYCDTLKLWSDIGSYGLWFNYVHNLSILSSNALTPLTEHAYLPV